MATLFFVHASGDELDSLPGRVDVVSLGDATVDGVVTALATHRGAPFLLGGAGEAGAVVAAAVDRLLSGEAPVFGLVGVVLVRPAEVGSGSFDLPALVLEPGLSSGTPAQPLQSMAGNGPGEAAGGRAAGVVHGAVGSVFPRARYAPADEPGQALDAFVAREIEPAPEVPGEWGRLIASDRTDVEVRSILARRAIADDVEYAPRVMDAAQLGLLREIADLVLPQDGPAIDLAARVDAQLARGEGDGWRHAALPPDPEAYRAGLTTLAASWPGNDPEGTLRAAIEGELDTAGPFDAAQLKIWLEDVRVDLVRQWLAHPATAARAGFDGFATGGTALPLRGFTELGAGRREAWEPASVTGVPA
ncbi:hypothetical protein ACFXQA_14745 [Microbacterium sp. P07]|uniref:hypothetical protein n=1 Tax=Microbacterium sp. P07 TaxID=3366952 RepID=UPI0037456765